ncbi:MAG: aspartate kinase [bacterium]
MALVVQKYGGTSMGSVERIQAVAERVGATQRAGNQVVVVVSAMSGETNRLLDLAHKLAAQPAEREVDVLLATGEQVSTALLGIALQEKGIAARAFQGHQIRIDTDSAYGRARIRSIDGESLRNTLAAGQVAVVAGFQGVDAEGHITTLGRGGSDTSAVAVAAALKADVCEIYTDVDGVYTTDPRICPTARKLARISHDEMLELASLGAKVLQIRSVEFAKRYNVPLCVRSSFDNSEGTWVVPEDAAMEQVLVSGVSLDRDQAKITIRHVPDKPGLASRVLGPIAEANIVVDMIIQNASAAGDTDFTFTLPKTDFPRALAMIERTAKEIGAQGVQADTEVVKVSVVGLGMRSHAGVAARMFEILAHEGINIQMISTSEIKISVVIEAKYGELAVRALHQALVEEAPAPQA